LLDQRSAGLLDGGSMPLVANSTVPEGMNWPARRGRAFVLMADFD
jgi:hypothetical protein